MEIVKCTKKEARPKLYSKVKNLEIIDAFIKTGYAYAYIKDFPHKNANSAATSLNRSAKNFGYTHIKFVSRGDVVYVMNKNAAEFE